MSKESQVIYKGKVDYELITKLSLVDWIESVSFSGIMKKGKPDFGGPSYAKVYLPQIHTIQEYLDIRAKVFDVMSEKFRRIYPDSSSINIEFGDIYATIKFDIPASIELMSEILGCKLEVKKSRMSYDSVSCSVGGGY